jgi:tetratricopeptide (TPR) repeat protein
MHEKTAKSEQGFCLSVLDISIFFVGLIILMSSPCLAARMDSGSSKPGDLTDETLPELYELRTDPKAAILNLAELRFEKGQWREAIGYARRVLSMDPGNVKAHGILGSIHALTAQKEQAEMELAFLEKAKKKGFYPELIKAMLKAQADEYGKAETHLAVALKDNPRHPLAVYYSGSLNLAQNRLDEAEKAFKRALVLESALTPALAGLGQVSLRRKNMKEAAEYYEKAVEGAPENLLYRRELLKIYRATGDKDAVNRLIKATLYYTPGVKQNYLKQGMQLLLAGSYLQAITLADKILGIYRDVPQALYIKAAAQANLKQEKEALENISSFVREQWASPRAHHYAGMCYLALNRMKEAEEQFRVVISINPNMGRSFVPLLIIEQLRGNTDRALEGLKLAKRGGEPRLLIHYLTAHVLLARGDLAGFRAEMRYASGLMPGLDRTTEFYAPGKKGLKRFAGNRNLMILYFLNGWYGKAVEISDTLLKQSTKDRFAWYYRALALSVQKKQKGAQAAYESLIRMEPGLYSAYMGMGRLHMGAGEFDKAVEAFKKVNEISPEYGPAYEALGDAFMQKKEEDKAIRTYERAAELIQKSPNAHIKLAMLLSEKPESIDKALAHAEKALSLAPRNPFALDVHGWVLVQSGDIKKAIPRLRKAAGLLPRNPLVHYHLGVAYFKNKNSKEAEKALRAALRISKSFPGADRAREILEKLAK